jgi:hypothetical protein
MLHYSRDVTTYSWTALWVTMSFLVLIVAIRSGQVWAWLAWAISLDIALYSHYFALFPLVVEALAVLAYGLLGGSTARRVLLPSIFTLLGATALYVPWLVVLLIEGRDVLGTPLFPVTVDQQLQGWLPVLLVGYQHSQVWQTPPISDALWLGLIVAALGGSIILVRKRAAGAGASLALVAAWAVSAFVGPYLFLRLTTPADAADPVRFAALAAPALLICLGALLAAIPTPLRAFLLVGWIAMSGVQWWAEATGPQTQDWRGILSPIAQNAKAGDALLAFTAFHAGAAAAYYSIPVPVEGGWFVGEGSDPTGAAYWFPPAWRWRGFLDSMAHRSTDWAGEFQARTQGATRLWYLVGDGTDGTYPRSGAAEQALAQAGWRAAGEWQAHPFLLILYQRASAP